MWIRSTCYGGRAADVNTLLATALPTLAQDVAHGGGGEFHPFLPGLILLLPLIGFLINGALALSHGASLGERRSGRWRVGHDRRRSDASVADVCGSWGHAARVHRDPREFRQDVRRRAPRPRGDQLLDMDGHGHPDRRLGVPARSAVDDHDDDHHRGRLPHPRVQRGVHEG